MRTALFWAITQRAVVIPTDVSGQHIGNIFKGQETSVRNRQYTLRRSPEERGSHLFRE
jgi:hypothetical protein